MTERKMEPWMLRDLAGILHLTVSAETHRVLIREAARREAEAAKPTQCALGRKDAYSCPNYGRECDGSGCAHEDCACEHGAEVCTDPECPRKRQGPDSAAADEQVCFLRARARHYMTRAGGAFMILHDDATAACLNAAADRIEALLTKHGGA